MQQLVHIHHLNLIRQGHLIIWFKLRLTVEDAVQFNPTKHKLLLLVIQQVLRRLQHPIATDILLLHR